MDSVDWLTAAPSTEEEWRAFLRFWSHAVSLAGGLDTQGWPNEGGATEEQISGHEVRLDVRLPPSYRAFLCVSNGWYTGYGAVKHVLPIQEVDWLHRKHPAFVDDWVKVTEEISTEKDPDDPVVALPGTLQVSEIRDEVVYLLNPERRNAGGEWEAWFFGSWVPGAEEFPSFGALMVARLRSIIYSLKKQSPGTSG